MKVLLVHQYFKIPSEGGGIRSYYMAKGLVEEGHEVTVITAHNGAGYLSKCVEGINVHYLPVFYSNGLSTPKRIWAYALFALRSIFLMGRFRDFDLCYTISTPLTTGLPALWGKMRYGLPYYFEVGDLWPEAPVQMGVIKNRWMKKILYWFEAKVYRKAGHIIALSPSIKTYIEERSPSTGISMVPNMADTTFFTPQKKNRSEEGNMPPKRLVLGYFGTVGMANQLEYLLDIAKAVREARLDISMVIVGTGARFEAIRQKAITLKLDNVSFFPHSDKAGVQELMARVDAVYISFKKLPVLEMGSPNKFFDGLAAGKMIILNFKGWLKELVETSECGIYADPEDPASFIETIRPFLSSPDVLDRYQKNARSLAERHYSREKLVQELVHIIESSKPGARP